MENPFKFGSVVSENFFTNRQKEVEEAKNVLSSNNHLVLISPRRFGKTSLINKVTSSFSRPVIYMDLQLVTDVPDLATQLLKKFLNINKWEKIKHFLANFKVVPTLELNPQTGSMEVSFAPSANNKFTPLEDVLNLIEKTGKKDNRPIVVLDEFQEIKYLDKNLSKQLRAVLQHHKNVNYVFLGSLESMMKAIFESKKSPFYHFGYLMNLDRIPYDDFFDYLKKRFDKVTSKSEIISKEILEFTNRHPYYTQQLAFYCFSFLEKEKYKKDMLLLIVQNITAIHNMDYERLWNAIKQTDKKILIALAMQEKPSGILSPTSTIYSGLSRLIERGYIVKNTHYEFDDPFFKNWIIMKRG
ncbi:MAG: ATP-binding protein [Fibromonadaceae bacterium]|jgi:AAA+ ATPase superfamily predicted ATPase|nr:ATP-binding protein [Fibromonadaceae bacterium]